MPERLKDLFFTDPFIQQLADAIEGVHPAFDRDWFVHLVYDATWEDLELKAKEIDQMTTRLKDLEESIMESQREDLNYFG